MQIFMNNGQGAGFPSTTGNPSGGGAIIIRRVNYNF